MADKQIEKYLPKLRFPEFKDKGEWETYTLEELFEIRNGYTPSKSNPNFWDGGTIPWFRMEDIRQNGHILSDSIQHITPAAVKGTGLFPAYSIIVATSATIGEHALLIADSLANQRFTFLTKRKSHDKQIDMMFFHQYMFIIDEWCKKNTNSGGLLSVNMPAFKQLVIPLPSIKEQNAISSLLSSLDECIAASKEKLEQLKAHKKGLMQKLFPASGKTLPEYRFKEFKNVWIEHALHDIGIFVKGLSYNSNDVTQDTSSTLVIRSTNIIPEQKVDCQNGLQFVIKRPSDEQILQKGDVAICLSNGSSNLVGKTSFFEGDYSGIATVGAFCGIYRSKVPITKYLVQTETYRKSIDLIKQGGNGALSNLYGNDILRLRFFLPAEEEQRKIASCLEQIDKMISLLGGKIDFLCLYKRGLLQQLFPSRIVSYVGTI